MKVRIVLVSFTEPSGYFVKEYDTPKLVDVIVSENGLLVLVGPGDKPYTRYNSNAWLAVDYLDNGEVKRVRDNAGA